MDIRSSRLIFSVSVVLVLVATVLVGVNTDPAVQAALVAAPVESVASDDNGLFSQSNARVSVNVPAQAIRYRNVTADFSPFISSSSGRAADTTEVADSLRLNLFSDVVLDAELDRYTQNMLGTASWMGHVDGAAQSEVMLVVKDNVMVGLITVGTDVYEIRYGGNGNQIILEVDQSKFVDHSDDWHEIIDAQIERYEAELAANPRAADIAADDGSVIDILVGYTDDARAGAGGTAAIESTAQLAVDATNTSYENSEITQRLQLVHLEEFSYAETGSSNTDLGNWRNNNDGIMDNAHTLRDTYHADLMMLLTEDGGGFCGIAYHQSTMSTAFEDDAFGVTARNCAVGNLSFAHEVGHNIGLRHDWYVDTATSPESYAHGHTYPDGSWRTVMAYNHYCSALGGFCTRLPYFSNPSVSYQGVAAGVEGGTSTSCLYFQTSPAPNSCDADAERLLNDHNAVFASWRSSKVTWIGNTSDWNTASNWSIDTGAPGSTVATNRVPLSIDDIYILASPTGGNFPVLSSGTAVARDVVLEDGASLTLSGGTLEVYGRWEEQGASGSVSATSGVVQFVGSLDQTVTTRAASTLPDVTIGNGSTSQQVAFTSDADIDGDFMVATGASVKAGSTTLHFSGDWNDEGNGFYADTSTVIFDGVSQSVTKTTNSTLVTEDFSDYPTCDCSRTAPNGWARSGDGLAFLFGDETAYHWDDSTDAWLFMPRFEFTPGVEYTISFDHLKRSTSTSSLTIAYGSSQSSSAMTNSIGVVSNGEMSTSFQNSSFTFTVNTAGTYYIGINSVQTNFYNRLDNISLTSEKDLLFYDLQIASGETTFNKPVVVTNELYVAPGATADFSTHTVNVNGSVTNNGAMQQTKDVPVSTTTRFLDVFDRGNSAAVYDGVDVTPSSGSMGSTTVTIYGNQACSSATVPVTIGVLRCYDIEPTTAQTAEIRFYYTLAEANWNPNPDVYSETSDGSDVWIEDVSSTDGGSDNALYVDSAAISNYGQFALSSNLVAVILTGDDGIITEQAGGVTTTYTFTATLNTATSGPFSVPVNINDGTATAADGDYTDNDQTLNFAGTTGETKTFTVAINGDDKVEENETFNITLGSPSDGTTETLGTPLVSTIMNDDTGTITLSGGTSQTEGDSGTTSYVFTATLDSIVQDGVTVGYATADVTALAGSDYVSSTGILTFTGNIGETQTVTVLANSDTMVEADEQFTLSLATPDHAFVTVAGTPQTATILNDDVSVIEPTYLSFITR